MNWDSIIGIIVIVAFVLVIWAKVSKQTVGDVIKDIKNMITDKTEDIEEIAEGVVVYE